MLRKVVLPEPDGPVTATNSRVLHFQAKVPKSMSLHQFSAIDLVDVLHHQHGFGSVTGGKRPRVERWVFPINLTSKFID